MVSNRRWGSVVSRISNDCGGGSSRVLRKAFAAASFIRSAATMMPILWRLSVGFRLTASNSTRAGLSSRRTIWPILIRRVFDSGRTQNTSAWLPSSIFRQFRQTAAAVHQCPVAFDRLQAIQGLGQRAGQPFQHIQLVAGKEVGMRQTPTLERTLQ